MNILVIDDEVVQVKSLKRGLRSLGYNVLESFSAEDGLKIIQSDTKKVNLILTDYAMPGMNGIGMPPDNWSMYNESLNAQRTEGDFLHGQEKETQRGANHPET